MATLRQVQITFDSAQPLRLARFWCEALGYELPSPPDDFSDWDAYNESLPEAERDSWATAVDPTGAGPRLYIQRVPEGKVAKNRVHLDVRAGIGLVGDERLATLTAERDRLVSLGAVCDLVMVADEENESCINMRDIEGNEFCLD